MDLFHYFFILLFLAHSCIAGPLIIQAARVAKAAAGAREAEKFLSTDFAKIFGVGPNDVWFGDSIIINRVLYHGTNFVGKGALAGGAAGGLAAGVANAGT